MVDGPDLIHGCYSPCGVIRELTNQIYFVGGRGTWGNNNLIFFSGTQIFDMVKRQFSIHSAHMSAGRGKHVCTILQSEDILIAAGGRTGDWATTDSVEVLDLQTETWRNARVMPTSTTKLLATGEFLFAWETNMFQYEPATDQWLEFENVPFDLSQLTEPMISVDAGIGDFCPYL